MDGETARRCARPIEFTGGGLIAANGLSDRIEQFTHPHQLPKPPSHRTGGGKIQQANGALVDEEEALVGIQGDHPLHHAVEDGFQLGGFAVDLFNLAGQPLRHSIESPTEDIQLAVVLEVDSQTGFALAGPLGETDQPA